VKPSKPAGEGAKLEVSDTKGTRSVAIPAGPLTIGRNITNLLAIDEPMASKFHCVIERWQDGYRVRDLDSRNGTMVNGQVVKTAILSSDDVVKIGETELRLLLHGAAPGWLNKKRSRNRETSAEEQAAEDLSAALEPAPLEQILDDDSDAHSALSGNTPDWERLLRDRADSLPNKPFREYDIALINARGQTSHAPAPSANKPPPGTEAVTLLRLIMLICFRSRATDIHVEIKQEDAQVRIRVDGAMVEILRIYKEQRELAIRLLSLVKVLSEIDIAQKNIVQEGSFSARIPSGKPGQPVRRVDYRVSFAPAVYGQKLVIRILDTGNAPQRISDLAFPDSIAQAIRQMITRESGMIMACGPTGSGKTTTLYAVLRDIDVEERNVVTIEDPVEIQIAGVTQIPVNEGLGNTFGALLKSVLRQDPDIILVGEVRDAETARIAVQAAMTGHLVFSTVHSRDTVGAVYRLLDLGVEPYLVSSGLQMVLAQRLVRQLCPHCKSPVRPTREQLAKMAQCGIKDVREIFQPQGCRRCLNTGFFGRHGIVELLSFNQELRDVVMKTPTVQEILKTLGPANFVRLSESGFQLVADGITSFDEVERAVA
jgi:general secretion pathway protein E